MTASLFILGTSEVAANQRTPVNLNRFETSKMWQMKASELQLEYSSIPFSFAYFPTRALLLSWHLDFFFFLNYYFPFFCLISTNASSSILLSGHTIRDGRFEIGFWSALIRGEWQRSIARYLFCTDNTGKIPLTEWLRFSEALCSLITSPLILGFAFCPEDLEKVYRGIELTLNNSAEDKKQ